MFLRLWWLHECILVLLDYPQISSFFKEDRLAMLRALVQCFAVIGICVGIYQAVEGYYGTNPLDYFTTTYFMMVVFSSVGYGDILISTALSRFLLIVLMMVGAAYFVPLLDYIANLGVKHLNYKTYTRWFKRTDHVIIAGKFERNDLRLQLDNIFAGKRCYLQLHVVVMLDDQPDPGILVLLNAPKYRSSVTLLVGDPGNETDLDRCNARGASAIFLFGKGVNSSYYSDYDTAKQATTISNYVRKVPLFVFLHRSRYTRSMIPPGVCILEVERMNQILLGLGAVLPGMLPLVGNLIRQFDPMSQFQVWNSTDFENPKKGAIAVARAVRNIGAKQREMFSYGNFFGENENASGDATVNIEDDINWKHIYEASMAQQIIVLPMPEEQKGRSFRSMAHFLFKQGVTLIGAVRKIEGTETTYIDIACSGKLVDAVKLIVISDKEKAVLSAFETLPPVVEGNVRDTLGFDDPRSFTALRDLVESELGLAGGSFAFSPASINQSFAEMHNIHLTPNVDNRNSFDSVVVAEGVTHEEPVKESYKPADGVAIVSGSEEGEPLLREEGGLGEPRTSASDVPSREMTAEIMAESLQKLSQDPQFMKKVTSLRNVTSPHPSHLTPEIAPAAIVFAENASHLTNHIVFVELSSGLEVTSWSSEARVESFTTKVTDMFDALHPVRQHSPLVNIVLLANEDDYTFLQTMWEQESHGILTIVQGCGLVYEDLRKCNFQEAASVVVFCAGERNDPQGDIMSVLTAKSIRELCQSEIPIVVELDETWHTHLLSRNSFPGSSLNYTTEPSFMSGTVVCRHMLDTCLQESFFTPELMGVLEQILAGRQDALMVTSLQCKAGWATYMDVVDYCLDRRLLPLGIHRRHTEDRRGGRAAGGLPLHDNEPAGHVSRLHRRCVLLHQGTNREEMKKTKRFTITLYHYKQ
ncbi:potassium channel subunit-like protein [Angomonas deanei]|uniref:Ion channel, putative n=1 Tax=Angomonas deanei TaxID=59799 RepID=A0A7G2CSQ1_9TRYP|nr:potassium channel subunit-like protein [Angomonas deanei]CAD2221242.1 Ion channel, putative [Angomonas deanei]|eukprot:EPY31611.1 potassium channel subunit-like protein [Angomonas deanei]